MWNWCYHYQYIIFALPLCLNPVISWLLSRKHDHRVPVADSWVFSSDPLTRADSSSPRLLRTLVWEHWLQSLHRCIPHWELSLGTRNCLPKVTPLLGDKPWPMMSWSRNPKASGPLPQLGYYWKAIQAQSSPWSQLNPQQKLHLRSVPPLLLPLSFPSSLSVAFSSPLLHTLFLSISAHLHPEFRLLGLDCPLCV